jgi:proteasome assembly chaperone (PAC2) family protein
VEHLRWSTRPELHQPVVIAAFEGWNDAGDAATTAARYLVDRWDADHIASIDPEEFYDFTANRPHVRLDDDGLREIVWPANELYAGTIPGGTSDVIILVGNEPALRWRTFSRQITELAIQHHARMVLTLGALLADVPHSRPVSVIGNAYDPAMIERLQLEPSRYQGPTGIVGVLHAACREADLPSASLWAAVPTYVSGATSPKAALALVEHTARMLDVYVATTDLEIAAAAYERQITELVAGDDETSGYVESLERRYDEGGGETASTTLIEEVERYLRDRPHD